MQLDKQERQQKLEETFQSVINVNLVGTFLCTREAVKIFKAQTPQGGKSRTPEHDCTDLRVVY